MLSKEAVISLSRERGSYRESKMGTQTEINLKQRIEQFPGAQRELNALESLNVLPVSDKESRLNVYAGIYSRFFSCLGWKTEIAYENIFGSAKIGVSLYHKRKDLPEFKIRLSDPGELDENTVSVCRLKDGNTSCNEFRFTESEAIINSIINYTSAGRSENG